MHLRATAFFAVGGLGTPVRSETGPCQALAECAEEFLTRRDLFALCQFFLGLGHLMAKVTLVQV
jgi:hypothetical protein